jgi:hypothetical protein
MTDTPLISALSARSVLAQLFNRDGRVMSLKHLVQATVTLVMFGGAMALGAASPAAAQSPSYPWCAQGGSIIRCWYMTREQCEETVNHHGFCVTDPNVPHRAGDIIRREP